jgi:hypothetical protein
VSALFKLLEDRIFWFRKYLACTEAFLAALKHAPDIALDELEFFHGNRESLLKILDSLEGKIQAIMEQEAHSGPELSSELTTKVQYYLREKESLVASIIRLDREVMAEIDTIRLQGEEKLKLLAKGKKALAKYKSTGSQNERIDKRV